MKTQRKLTFSAVSYNTAVHYTLFSYSMKFLIDLRHHFNKCLRAESGRTKTALSTFTFTILFSITELLSFHWPTKTGKSTNEHGNKEREKTL